MPFKYGKNKSTGKTGWGKAENITENFSNNASKNDPWLTKNRGSDEIYYKRAGNGTLYYISKTNPMETTWNEEEAITVAEYEKSRSNTPTANAAPAQNAQPNAQLNAPNAQRLVEPEPVLPAELNIDGGRGAPLPPSSSAAPVAPPGPFNTNVGSGRFGENKNEWESTTKSFRVEVVYDPVINSWVPVKTTEMAEPAAAPAEPAAPAASAEPAPAAEPAAPAAPLDNNNLRRRKRMTRRKERRRPSRKYRR